MKLNDLMEGIEDKGIFKAVFVVGSPAAGKTFLIKKITDGQVQPRIVNTDKTYEFLSNIKGVDIGKEGDPSKKRMILDKSKQLTKNQLVEFINGMLPLFIDGTSSDASNILRRISLLESIGYDVGMVWVHTDLETALERAKERERHVPEEIVKRVHERTEKNVNYIKGKLRGHFWKIDNDEGTLTDDVILKAYQKVSGFFHKDVENPVGERRIQKMKENNWKYLAPNVYTKEQLQRFVGSWYIKRGK